jgi:acetylglutamate/LysW-gamma-L-alpha-aminoadipate kinase
MNPKVWVSPGCIQYNCYHLIAFNWRNIELVLVVKIGGAIGTGFENLAQDLTKYKDFILVHGGSHDMNIISEKLEIPPRFVTSISGHVSRYTDEATLDVLKMVYSGKVNKTIIETMRKKGINAIGLSGLDGGLLKGKRKEAIRIVEGGKRKILRGDNTGKVEEVNSGLLRLLLNAGYIPVITIPIEAFDGGGLNADADRAAAAVASAMGANTLVILSNVPGLLKDPEDDSTLIEAIPKGQLESYVDFAQKRMKKKILGASEAIAGGVDKVIIGNANIDNPLTKALSGLGTVIE